MPPPRTTPEQLARYKAVFDSLDLDGGGTITPDEVEAAFASLGKDVGDMAELQELLAAGDIDGDGEITFEEFVQVMENHYARSAEQLGLDPNNFDLDSDGEGEDDDDGDGEGGEGGAGDLDEALRELIGGLSEEDVQVYRKLFFRLDMHNKHELSAEVVQEFMNNQRLRGLEVPPEEMEFYFALIQAAGQAPGGVLHIEHLILVAHDHLPFIEAFRASLQEEDSGDEEEEEAVVGGGVRLEDADPALIARFREVFDEFDDDGNGTLSHSEVSEAMNKLGRVPDEDESQFIFTLLALVGDEGLTFEQFALLMLESSEDMARLGQSVETWKSKQTHLEAEQSRAHIRTDLAKLGLGAAIAREDDSIALVEESRLQRINNVLSAPVGVEVRSHAPGRIAAQPSHLLTPDELRKYQVVFNKLDKNKDGSITVAEFSLTIKGVIGRQPTQEEMKTFLSQADTDGNDSLDFEEFVAIMQRTKKLVEERQAKHRQLDPKVTHRAAKRILQKYREVFDRVDENKNGRVTARELVNFLRRMDKHPSEVGCKRLILSVDRNGNGSLDFDEFVSLMQRKTVPKDAAEASRALAEAILHIVRF